MKRQVKIVAKPSIAAILGKSSLAQLPTEILAAITDELAAISPESAANVRRVNSQLYHLARASLHRDLHFDLGEHDRRCMHGRCERIVNQGMLWAIRTLTVDGEIECLNGKPERIHASMIELAELIPRMPSLRRLVYRGQSVPTQIVRALERTTDVALDAQIRMSTGEGCMYHGPWPDTRLDSLQRSKHLQALSLALMYDEPESCRELMLKAKDIIISAPNLRSLSLDIRWPDQCYQAPFFKYCGLGLTTRERLPPLHNFELLWYQFPFGATFDYPGDVPEFDYWAGCDWTQLRHFKTADIDFALNIMPYLTALETFEFTKPFGDSKPITQFLLGVPTELESIHVPTLEYGSIDCLLRHAPKLRKLYVHKSDIDDRSWSEKAITIDALNRLQSTCTRLTDLTIDLVRSDGEWPYEALATLAGFSALRKLNIWFELRVAGSEQRMEPHLTASAAEHIFRYIIARQSDQSFVENFSLVTHCGGAVPQPGYGCTFAQPRTVDGKSTFLCKVGTYPAATEHFKVSITDLQSPPYDNRAALGDAVCDNKDVLRSGRSPAPKVSRLSNLWRRTRTTRKFAQADDKCC